MVSVDLKNFPIFGYPSDEITWHCPDALQIFIVFTGAGE
jgi:hypothetical protein